jgi:hypothetical protein
MNAKLLFKLDVPRKWIKYKISRKKHDCNFMGMMLLQQIAKPMLQTSKELQNKDTHLLLQVE